MPEGTVARKEFHIDLPAILDIVGRGTRRASSFMALGLRSAADETVTSLALDTNFQIFFMPHDISREQVAVTHEHNGNIRFFHLSSRV